MISHFKIRFCTEEARKEEGFTLAEMLVVLMIVAMMTTLSFPYLAGRNSSNTTEKFADKLQTMLKQSKQLALIQNQTVEVIFLQSPRRFQSKKLKITVDVPAKLRIQINVGQDEIKPEKLRLAFYPDGSSSGGAFKITGEKKPVLIKVDWLTGVIDFKQEKSIP